MKTPILRIEPQSHRLIEHDAQRVISVHGEHAVIVVHHLDGTKAQQLAEAVCNAVNAAARSGA